MLAVTVSAPLAAASTPPAQDLALNFNGIYPHQWTDSATGDSVYFTTPGDYRLDLSSSASGPLPVGTPFTITYDDRMVAALHSSFPAGPVTAVGGHLVSAVFYSTIAMQPGDTAYFSLFAELQPAAAAGNGPVPTGLSPITLTTPRSYGPLQTDVTYS